MSILSQGKDGFLGRCIMSPLVRLEGHQLPEPPLQWFKVTRGQEDAGELLAACELFLVRLKEARNVLHFVLILFIREHVEKDRDLNELLNQIWWTKTAHWIYNSTRTRLNYVLDSIHKWRPMNYSFVFVVIILTSLTLKQKFFWILLMQTRLVRMISIKTKE